MGPLDIENLGKGKQRRRKIKIGKWGEEGSAQMQGRDYKLQKMARVGPK